MEIHIRPGAFKELPELISLQSLSLKAAYDDGFAFEQINALVESQAKARELVSESIIVAEVNREIVGFASLSDATWQIYAVYVHPNWMRRSIGKQLLAAIEEIAVQRRYRSLRVITASTAVFFYQSQGYEVQRPLAFRIQSKVCIPCQLLEKHLLPPDPVSKWVHRHRLILLLLLTLFLVISMHYSEKKNTQPQFNLPSHNVESL